MKTETNLKEEAACFFCDSTAGSFRKVETMFLDNRVRQIAKEL